MPIMFSHGILFFFCDFKYDVILGIVVSCDIAIGDFVLWTSNW